MGTCVALLSNVLFHADRVKVGRYKERVSWWSSSHDKAWLCSWRTLAVQPYKNVCILFKLVGSGTPCGGQHKRNYFIEGLSSAP